MLTLHYGTANGYPANGDASTYLDYTTLTNMSSERINESKSPLAHVIHSLDGTGNGTSGEPPYGYYEGLDVNGPSYGHSPVPGYSQTQPGKSPHFDYTLQGDGYTSSSPEMTQSLPHQISVTIGPGTSQQRTLPVIYDPMQTPKGKLIDKLRKWNKMTKEGRVRERDTRQIDWEGGESVNGQQHDWKAWNGQGNGNQKGSEIEIELHSNSSRAH